MTTNQNKSGTTSLLPKSTLDKNKHQRQHKNVCCCHMLAFVIVSAFVTYHPHCESNAVFYAAALSPPPSLLFASKIPTPKRGHSFALLSSTVAPVSEGEQPIAASYSPLSMGIDELSSVLDGRGRALASWDCYRQGIDPYLFYSSADRTASTIMEGMSPFLEAGANGTITHDTTVKVVLPKNRATQGLGKDSLYRLRKAFPHNPQEGTIEHCVGALSHVSTSSDGTTKLLIRFAKDGLEAETVIIPWEKRKRSTLCISSQVGCRQGCTFCATGRMGKLRSLSSDEIIVQMYYATQVIRLSSSNKLYPIDNVVFMGMGEPADNVDNVVRACQILTDRQLFQLARSKVTISTVAPTPNAFRDLAAAQVTLAWSVHAVCDATRRFLIPTFDPNQYTMEHMKTELCDVLNSELSTKRLRTIMLEVVLLNGVNDAVQNAIDLADFSQSMIHQVPGLKLVVNLIPWNDIGTNNSRTYKTPKPQTVREFQSVLTARGIYTFIRTTRGDDESAACGQLATSRIPAQVKNTVPYMD